MIDQSEEIFRGPRSVALIFFSTNNNKHSSYYVISCFLGWHNRPFDEGAPRPEQVDHRQQHVSSRATTSTDPPAASMDPTPPTG